MRSNVFRLNLTNSLLLEKIGPLGNSWIMGGHFMSTLSSALLFDFHRPKQPFGVVAISHKLRALSVPCEVAADILSYILIDLRVDCNYCCVLPINDSW